MRAQAIAANSRPRQGILAFPRLRRKPGWAARPVKTARLGKTETPVAGEEPPGRDLLKRGLDAALLDRSTVTAATQAPAWAMTGCSRVTQCTAPRPRINSRAG